MSKRTTLKKADEQAYEDDIFDKMFMESPEEEIMLELLGQISGIDRDQSQISLELTKLIVEKTTDAKIKGQDILSIFERSKQVVSSSSPLQDIFEKMG